jgi:hypothetical protein
LGERHRARRASPSATDSEEALLQGIIHPLDCAVVVDFHRVEEPLDSISLAPYDI